MKHFFIFLAAVLFISTLTFGQDVVKQAYLDENGVVQVKEVITNETISTNKQEKSQVNGFPVYFGSNTTYKNFRGVTLANLDGQPGDEIIISTNDSVYVVKGNGSILWQAKLNGLAQWPPTVGDINNDGKLEVIVASSYATQRGAIDVFDNEGNALAGFPYVITRGPVSCAPTLGDIDGDGYLDIIFGTRGSAAIELDPMTRVINYLAEDVAGFPVSLGATPAVTPSVADINHDGKLEIITASVEGWYIFDNEGNILENYPILDPDQDFRFSYQSPLVADLDSNGDYDIVGATHGNTPVHYVLNALSGEFRTGWPKYIPDQTWTYSAPTVVYLEDENDYAIFASRPLTGDESGPMLWKYDKNGNIAPGFPISKVGGLEGFISIADINDDGDYEILFGSNIVDSNYDGYIHAYNMDGTPVTENFPLRPHGFTFMNGVNLGDVVGDGKLYLIALSYENTFSADDKTLVNVYPLDVDLNENTILYQGYKGNNYRNGYVPTLSLLCDAPVNLQAEQIQDELQIVLTWEHTLLPQFRTFNVYRDDELIAENISELSYTDINANIGENIYAVTTNYIDCESDAATIDLTLLGISNYENNVQVYPNPAKEFINVKCNNMKSIIIYNNIGQIVEKIDVSGSNEYKVNIQNYSSGFYFIDIMQNNNVTSKVKVVIQ
ncbi:MAG: T9SS type A sorting domain-containing protein [Bacteroidales bacterium]|jgi:hypothetical protein|nr:T9SS type A sorting domain-containing protein [Bacteroidales bacterium]